MTTYESIPLSIVICSTRPINTCALLSSLLLQLEEHDQAIVIFDVTIEPRIQSLFSFISQSKAIQIYYNKRNEGLSFCRNFGMQQAKNAHLIFFDDDVLLPEKILADYRVFFSKGLSAIGGPLKLPPFYRSLPRWLPNGLSSLLGIHTCQKRVWGGNFGFNLELALKNQIFFKDSLGRKNGGLQSGDETDFLRRYCLNAEEPQFFEELFVYHAIDLHRFKFSYLMKRAFWQGRSERRKRSVLNGIQKEFKRALTTSEPKRFVRLLQSSVGIALFFIFCLGVVRELFYREN